jgi:hypothetical protein
VNGQDVVVLHQLDRGVFTPNISPFPLKLETYIIQRKRFLFLIAIFCSVIFYYLTASCCIQPTHVKFQFSVRLLILSFIDLALTKPTFPRCKIPVLTRKRSSDMPFASYSKWNVFINVTSIYGNRFFFRRVLKLQPSASGYRIIQSIQGCALHY